MEWTEDGGLFLSTNFCDKMLDGFCLSTGKTFFVDGLKKTLGLFEKWY